jgi:3-(3-hydroxy-phenyl)propionate hydroxylase
VKQYRTKIVVAGAGPVGSVAAYLLAQQGIDVLLVEAGKDNAADLRASTFHPPTLEMLEPYGITHKLIKMGLKAAKYHFRERKTGEVIEFDMGDIADVTPFPFRIQCEQYHLSRMLSEEVARSNCAEALFDHRVIGLKQNANGVDVYAETPHEIVNIKADFLIGADGSNSMVRKWLETGFDGFTYPEKFLCFTTKEPLEDTLPNLCHVNYVSDPEEWYSCASLRCGAFWLRPMKPKPTTISCRIQKRMMCLSD